MFAFAIVASAVAYLAFGAALAFAIDSSLDFKIPRWLQILLITLLWPLAIFVFFYAFMSWISGGSH